MKIPSNKIKDIKRYMQSVLGDIYPDKEITVFAEILLEAYAGIKRSVFYAEPDKTVNESVLLKINTGIKQLKNFTPIQYIVGYTHFCGTKINVNPSVLIPRPETEELVSHVVNYLNTQDKSRVINILDAGTGSGAIAIAIKKECPYATIYAFDISDEALEKAKENAANHKLSLTFFKADMFDGAFFTELPLFDVIVSNPPYVRQSEKLRMQSNVLDYEPKLALFVNDENPLIYYEALAKLASKLLKPSGVLFCEINEALGKNTKQLFLSSGFENAKIIMDINEKDRFVCALI